MRLLRVSAEGEISFTHDFAEEDVPPYAILSHTWGADEEEVTFTDIRDGCGRVKPGFKKIDFCAKQARRDDIEYLWVDTCCIDKTNSVELQEAIISMFRWYHRSRKCYVYLTDVSLSTDDHTSDVESRTLSGQAWERDFRQSRWFTRGWTLQELVAPPVVEFFSTECRFLGTKKTLVSMLHKITSIPLNILNGAPLSQASMDERVRWTKERKTKKPEDKAYCLIGIFDVSIPLIYGEGSEAAAYRLSRAINEKIRVSRQLQSEEEEDADHESELSSGRTILIGVIIVLWILPYLAEKFPSLVNKEIGFVLLMVCCAFGIRLLKVVLRSLATDDLLEAELIPLRNAVITFAADQIMYNAEKTASGKSFHQL